MCLTFSFRHFDLLMASYPLYCDRYLCWLGYSSLRLMVVPLRCQWSTDVMVAVDQPHAVHHQPRGLWGTRLRHLPGPSPNDHGPFRTGRHWNVERLELCLREPVTFGDAPMEEYVARRRYRFIIWTSHYDHARWANANDFQHLLANPSRVENGHETLTSSYSYRFVAISRFRFLSLYSRWNPQVYRSRIRWKERPDDRYQEDSIKKLLIIWDLRNKKKNCYSLTHTHSLARDFSVSTCIFGP